MKPFKPVRWPVRVFVRDHDGDGNLRPTKRGRRDASNRGFWIVISKNAMRDRPWIIEQEKYESRYWVLHFWRLIDFFWFYSRLHKWWAMGKPHYHKRFVKYIIRRNKAAAHLASVECQSRAHEIRARLHGLGVNLDNSQRTAEFWAREYAITIFRASNYPFLKAAGWDEERVYQEIVRHL